MYSCVNVPLLRIHVLITYYCTYTYIIVIYMYSPMSMLHVQVCVNMIHVHVQDVVSINIRPITLQVVHIRYMQVD